MARARGCMLWGLVPLLGLRSPLSSLRSLRTLPGTGSEEKGMNKRVSLAPRGAGGPVPPPPHVRSAVQSGGRAQLLPRGRQCRGTQPGEAGGTGSWSRHAARGLGVRGLRKAGGAHAVRRDRRVPSPRLLPRAGRSGADAAAPRPRSRRGQPWSENAEPRPGPAPAPGKPCAALGPRHPQWPCGLSRHRGEGGRPVTHSEGDLPRMCEGEDRSPAERGHL